MAETGAASEGTFTRLKDGRLPSLPTANGSLVWDTSRCTWVPAVGVTVADIRGGEPLSADSIPCRSIGGIFGR